MCMDISMQLHVRLLKVGMVV